MLPGAIQNNAADRRILLHVAQLSAKQCRHFDRHGVALLRPVQRQPTNATFDSRKDLFAHVRTDPR
jgi:hypothetical protein